MEKQNTTNIRKLEEEIWARINKNYNTLKIEEQNAVDNISSCQNCHGCRNCRSCSSD